MGTKLKLKVVKLWSCEWVRQYVSTYGRKSFFQSINDFECSSLEFMKDILCMSREEIDQFYTIFYRIQKLEESTKTMYLSFKYICIFGYRIKYPWYSDFWLDSKVFLHKTKSKIYVSRVRLYALHFLTVEYQHFGKLIFALFDSNQMGCLINQKSLIWWNVVMSKISKK